MLVTDDGYRVPLPAGAMYDGAGLLSMIAEMMGRSITLIVPHTWFAQDYATYVRAAGWEIANVPDDVDTIDGIAAWMTYYRPGKAVHVGTLPLIDPDRCPLFSADDDPATIARRLCDFQRMVGTSYRTTPGVTGVALLRGLYDRQGPGRQPRWKANERPGEVRGIGDVTYYRPLRGVERECQLVHGYDIHGAYQSAASMAELSWSDLVHMPAGATFDPGAAGMWRITRDSTDAVNWPAAAPPIVPESRFLEDGTVWVTTPVGRLLLEFGAGDLDVVEAYVPGERTGHRPRSVRILREWSESLRDARRTLYLYATTPDERKALEATFKRVANETIGLLNPTKGTGAIVRPDWAWTIRDVARCNLLRKILQIHARTGRWPVEVRTDAVYYASNLDPDACAMTLGLTLPVEWKPGAWHYVGTQPAGMWADSTGELVA